MDCCTIPVVNGVPSGASSSSVIWRTVYEIDFSAEPSASLANGQNVFSDGTSWTVENAGSAATFRITNGNGIEFAAAAVNTAWNSGGGGFNAPVLWISLNDSSLAANRRLISDYDINRQYVFQLYNPLNNGDAATEVVNFNLYNVAGNPYAAAVARIAGACKGGNATVAGGVGMVTSTATPVLIGDYSADNVICFTPAVGQPSAMSGSSGQFSAGDWPAMSALRECGWLSSTAVPAASTSGFRYNDPSMRLAIAFPTGNVTASFSATVSRLRILGRS